MGARNLSPKYLSLKGLKGAWETDKRKQRQDSVSLGYLIFEQQAYFPSIGHS